MSDTRARRGLASQQGFALMEVMISAAVLVLVVLGVFAALDASTSTAGANKARTVAATLAERDQERMRAMRTTDIDAMNTAPYDVIVANVPYHVESKAEWMYDASGAEVSCGLAAGQASYMRITTTVTARRGGTAVKPVVIQSIVAPQVGAAAAGSLSVSVKGATGQPIPGVTVTAPPASTVETTNALGCAVFGALTAGTYNVTLSKGGHVDKEGAANPSKPITVTAGNMSTAEFAYDLGASLTVIVKTVPAGPDEPSKSVVAANSELGAGMRTFGPTTAVTGLTDTVTAGTFPSGTSFQLNNLFPFTSGYALYSGGCVGADPSRIYTAVDYFATYGGLKTLAPGQNGGTLTVYEPTTSIKVIRGAALQSAIPVWAYPTKPGCTNTRIYLGVTKSDGTGMLTYSGLPYGDYDLCAWQSGGTPQRATGTVRVDNPAGVTGPTLSLSSSSLRCGETGKDSTP
jgi:Tfp pilus assembly protein PilV